MNGRIAVGVVHANSLSARFWLQEIDVSIAARIANTSIDHSTRRWCDMHETPSLSAYASAMDVFFFLVWGWVFKNR